MAQTTGIINSQFHPCFFRHYGRFSEVVIDHVTECSISLTTDMRDITTKTSAGFKEILPGLKVG